MKFEIPAQVALLDGQMRALYDTMHAMQEQRNAVLLAWLQSPECPLQPGDAVEWRDLQGTRHRGEVFRMNVSFTHEPVAEVVHNNMRSCHNVQRLERVNN